jgi:hypothetical protein
MKRIISLFLLIPCVPLMAGSWISRPRPDLEIIASVSSPNNNQTESQPETHTFHWYSDNTVAREINSNAAAAYALMFTANRFSFPDKSEFHSFIRRIDNPSKRASRDINIPLDKDSETTYDFDLEDNTGKFVLTITTKVAQ